MEETLLLKEILTTLKRRFWIILLIAIIGGGIGKFIVSPGPAPTYEAFSLVLLEKQYEENKLIVNPEDNVRFLNTAQTLIDTEVILEQVKSELNLDKSLTELAGQINVTNENNSQIIRITVEDSDPELATNIVNTTTDIFQEELGKYLDVERITIIEQAKPGQELQIIHSRENANTAMGVILGLVFGTFLAFALEVFKRRKTLFS